MSQSSVPPWRRDFGEALLAYGVLRPGPAAACWRPRSHLTADKYLPLSGAVAAPMLPKYDRVTYLRI